MGGALIGHRLSEDGDTEALGPSQQDAGSPPLCRPSAGRRAERNAAPVLRREAGGGTAQQHHPVRDSTVCHDPN